MQWKEHSVMHGLFLTNLCNLNLIIRQSQIVQLFIRHLA